MTEKYTTQEKIDGLLYQANSKRNTSPEEALKYCKEANSLSESINYTKGSAISNQISAICCRQLAEFDNALEFNNKALALYKLLEDEIGQSKVLNSIANVYYSLSNYSKAIKYFDYCLSILNKFEDNNFLINVLSNQGLAYQESGEIEKALNCYLKSVSICKEKNIEIPFNLLNNVGIAYQELEDYNNSLKYFYSALTIEDKLNDLRNFGFTLGNIGISFSKMGDHTNAITYLSEALIMLKKYGNKYAEANVYLNIGISFREFKYYPDAFKYLNRALKYYMEINDRSFLAGTLCEIGKLNFELNNYKDAKNSFKQGSMMASEYGDEISTIECKIGLAKIYRKFQDYEKAINFLNEAKELSENKKNISKLSKINELLKLCYTEIGDYEKAVSALDAVYYNNKKLFEFNDERQINKIISETALYQKKQERELEYRYA
jgi:tetratricopeptide (TPR) repeat protein